MDSECDRNPLPTISCKVRTAHQPLKGQQATSYIAPQTAGDFFNGQPKTLDGQNLSSFSSALD